MPYDVVIVGTSFASSFFLLEYLRRAGRSERILVLERGKRYNHRWRLDHGFHSELDASDTFVNENPRKNWVSHVTFGGNSNCWWACTPRMLPNDFRTATAYGVGVDWPMTYDDLEEYYTEVEAIMSVSGPSDGSPFPRSRPYPEPPHRFSDPDRLLKKAYPDTFFQMPTARTRSGTEHRAACCASGVCTLCPIDSKFTVMNELSYLYEDERVELRLGANVETMETRGSTVSALEYEKDGKREKVEGELFVLGANAIFNPAILKRSGIDHPLLGAGLNEQVSVSATVDLDGVDNYQGSTSITGHGYMLYDGEHRRERAGCLIESFNIPRLRMERGKWRQRLFLKFIFEALPETRNRIRLPSRSGALPETFYEGHSDYTQRGIDALSGQLPGLLDPLPIENVSLSEEPASSEGHIQGTTPLGDDPESSIVDRHLVHHSKRNLLVLGSGTFPTTAPANPTLTLSALSLWAARHL